jgi:hypothetical protein
VQELSLLFDSLCQERHLQGESEYGHLTFLENNTIAMLLEELIDAANYARYTFISIVLAAQRAGVPTDSGAGHNLNLGPKSFTPTSPRTDSGKDNL